MTEPAPTCPTIHDLVTDHLSLVAALARRAYRDCRGTMDLEELIAVGNQGLVEAATRYRDQGGASFSTFAYYRVQGAITDAMRREGPLPRRVARALRKGQHVRDAWKLPMRRPQARAEVADLDQTPVDQALGEHQERARVRAALTRLAPRERRIVERHYFDELTLTDVGHELGVSKSRASRLHGRAVGRLRRALEAA